MLQRHIGSEIQYQVAIRAWGGHLLRLSRMAVAMGIGIARKGNPGAMM
jgi:hypothetical protein